MSAVVKVAEASQDPSAVTSVICHTVRAGSESWYEAWFRDVTAVAQTSPGHRGVDFIRPPKGSRTYTIVLHFNTGEHLRLWLSSDARKRLIAEIKQFLITWSVIFPLTILIPWALHPLFQAVPFLGLPVLPPLFTTSRLDRSCDH
jgi:antibiotic biosynthesis monooxygenase (ABM) superfamily enzyme